MLWVRLGYYALWDDEANTAIFAHNVSRFGDTLAWDGTNIVAFRDGLELTGLKNRVFPPAQYFFAAPSLLVFGRTAFAARFPFTLAALMGFLVWAHWLRKTRPHWTVFVLTGAGILGNVSLFLYSRQARYYGLGWSLCLAIVYLYIHRRESRRNRILLTVLSALLIPVHYLTYGATMVCLACDYAIFEFRSRTENWRQLATFFGVQALALAVVLGVFWPFGRQMSDEVSVSFWADRWKLFLWNLRDINACEFCWTPMLGLAVLVWAMGKGRDPWLIRGVLALVLFAAMASLLSPQPLARAVVADIRYMSTAIPLAIALSVRTLTGLPRALGLLCGGLIFFTSLPHLWFQWAVAGPTPVPRRCTLLTWIAELATPQRSAFSEASAWLNTNVPAGSTILVLPDKAIHPLMFHSPQLRYMWQLSSERRADYPMLEPFHFRGTGIPDVVVAFGNEVGRARRGVGLLALQGLSWEPEVRLDVLGPDATRPELFWRVFVTRPVDLSVSEGTSIFRRRPIVPQTVSQ
ncbi:hypothetical protein IV102_18025 [bacterium]|nr:hypothetical protein [bacterium]